jgi:hypothetical protein
MVKRIVVASLLVILCSFCYAQNNKTFDTANRITFGTYNEFNSPSKRGIMEGGYDYILSTAYITPKYNLFDFGIGLSAILVWDDVGRFELPTVGFTIDTVTRIYAPSIGSARLYAEADCRMVMYTENYPPNGTWLNIGWHAGPGMDYQLSDGTRIFGTLLWWHSSNGNIYGKDRNPTVNAIGTSFGLQFK